LYNGVNNDNCLVTNYVLYCLNAFVYIKNENVWHQNLSWTK
jgi:hypothetical protein